MAGDDAAEVRTTARAPLWDELRRYSRRYELLLLTLSLLCIGASYGIDRRWADELGPYPVTANLLAGVLGAAPVALIALVALDRLQRRAERLAVGREDATLATRKHAGEFDQQADAHPLRDLAVLRELRDLGERMRDHAALGEVPAACGPSLVSARLVRAAAGEPEGVDRLSKAMTALMDGVGDLAAHEAGRGNLERVRAVQAALADADADLVVLRKRLERQVGVGIRLLADPEHTWDGKHIRDHGGWSYTLSWSDVIEAAEAAEAASSSIAILQARLRTAGLSAA